MQLGVGYTGRLFYPCLVHRPTVRYIGLNHSANFWADTGFFEVVLAFLAQTGIIGPVIADKARSSCCSALPNNKTFLEKMTNTLLTQYGSEYRARIKVLRQMLRQQEWDHKTNGPWKTDHPESHAVKCTAILELIAELKGEASSHAVRTTTDRKGFLSAVTQQKEILRSFVINQSRVLYYV